MDVIGYSERGAVNSLFYEIAYSSDAAARLAALVSRATFPHTERCPPGGEATVLVEQSFSQFGDSDAVIVYTDQPSLVFVEAKVKTWGAKEWSIGQEYSKFVSGLQTEVSSSNLFAQLYFKYRLVGALRSRDSSLLTGVEFPEWSSRRRRKIGANQVVLRAVDCLRSGIDEVFYLALIPERTDRVATFFDATLDGGRVKGVTDWDMSMCGYLTWDQVAEFCAENSLRHTLAVLAFNEGQIF
jgi:hypothetical protein